jgi:hypothetical protein
LEDGRGAVVADELQLGGTQLGELQLEEQGLLKESIIVNVVVDFPPNSDVFLVAEDELM